MRTVRRAPKRRLTTEERAALATRRAVALVQLAEIRDTCPDVERGWLVQIDIDRILSEAATWRVAELESIVPRYRNLAAAAVKPLISEAEAQRSFRQLFGPA